MKQEFAAAKQDMSGVLSESFSSYRDEFSNVNDWPDYSFDLLEDFVSRGKMMRGGLCVLFAQALGASRDDAVRAGAALELFQAGILVHDDIMDEDELRRGKAAIHAQLTSEFGESFGLGGGICVGDICMFLSFRLLNTVGSPQLVELLSREAASLGFGQMQDVFLGRSQESVELDDILRVYRYKTARYTFCLPLLLACSLAQRDDLFDEVCLFGEHIGVSFQIRDDVLGLFGSSDETGKPVGADIREDKKTVVRLELLRLAEGDDEDWLRSVFGSEVSSEDVDRVVSLAKKYDVLSAVQLHANVSESRAMLVLDELQVPTRAYEVLEWVVRFNRSRVK